jgi:peptide/nickel transport system permease protein
VYGRERMALNDPTELTPVGLQGPSVQARGSFELFWNRFKKDKAAVAGLVVIAILVLIALFAPFIANNVAHHGPNELFQREMTNEFGLPKGPSKAFWFGADSAGRDVFVRTLYGARTSLIVALIATGIAVIIGVTLGTIAGYFGGWVDGFISRIIDIMLSIPLLLFAIGISAACSISATGCLGGTVKPGIGLVVFIISIFTWTSIARVIRGQVLSLRSQEFVEAARSLGASNLRIMRREILPNIVAPIVIYATLLIPSNILFESYLSFLGLGMPQSIPSWGRMVADAAPIFEVAWWLMFFPGMFLLTTTLGFNLLGDGLRDSLDPRGSR